MQFVKEEEKHTADFYALTRKKRKNAEIFSALGNHDIRVWNYADKNMKEILDQITPESLWGLDNLGIDYIYYEDMPQSSVRWTLRPPRHSRPAGSGAAVKSDVMNLGVSLIRGHSHRMGAYYKTWELTVSRPSEDTKSATCARWTLTVSSIRKFMTGSKALLSD